MVELAGLHKSYRIRNWLIMLHINNQSFCDEISWHLFLSLFWQEALKHYSLVFDAIYTPKMTRLLREAQESGATIVYGTEMFINQAFVQFEKFTGLPGTMNQQNDQTQEFSPHQVYHLKFLSFSDLSLNFPCSTKATDSGHFGEKYIRNICLVTIIAVGPIFQHYSYCISIPQCSIRCCLLLLYQ